ncbi:hypothetical protein [Lentzea sp. E54]|uniref:hypothetical protein n=1 Tax=Lentzea xerophila TaxID=3435883 RepID=UPI003DA57A4D
MTVQRDNLDVAGAEAEVVQEAESVLEGTPVVEPAPVEPAPPTEVPQPPKKEEDPEVTPMCCGGTPGQPLIGRFDVVHEPGCERYRAS